MTDNSLVMLLGLAASLILLAVVMYRDQRDPEERDPNALRRSMLKTMRQERAKRKG